MDQDKIDRLRELVTELENQHGDDPKVMEAVEAIEDLLERYEKVRHIFAIQFKAWYFGADCDLVTYFDKRRISEDQVSKILKQGIIRNCPLFVTIPIEAAKNVFGYKEGKHDS